MCFIFATGCAAPQPDLERLYLGARDNTERPPVILIPGILGSKLVDASGREAWPGNVWDLMTSRYFDLELPVIAGTPEQQANKLYPGGLFDRAAGREYTAG